jgi:flagellar assembly protein FliH
VLKYVEFNDQNPLVLRNIKPNPILNSYNFNNQGKSVEAEQSSPDELMKDINKRAQDIIERAKYQAQKQLNDAQVQIEILKKQAFDQGYRDGFEKGKESFLKEKTEKWEQSLKQLDELRKINHEQNTAYKKRLEREALKLGFYVAEKILDERIQTDSSYLLSLIKKGLEKTSDEKEVIVRISDEDFKSFKVDKLKQIGVKNKKINVIMDPLLSAGDCIIEGNSFSIDTSVHSRLNNIYSKLKEMGIIDDE